MDMKQILAAFDNAASSATSSAEINDMKKFVSIVREEGPVNSQEEIIDATAEEDDVDEAVGYVRPEKFPKDTRVSHSLLPNGGVVVGMDGKTVLVRGNADQRIYRFLPISLRKDNLIPMDPATTTAHIPPLVKSDRKTESVSIIDYVKLIESEKK